MKTDAEKFLELLFDKNELLFSGSSYNSWKKPHSFEDTIKLLNSYPLTRDGVFVGLNSGRDQNITLSLENISHYRNFLIEMDSVKSIEQQLAFIRTSRLPFSSLVHSGNKSVHIIISLNEPLPVSFLDSYKQLHKAMLKRFGPFADTATNKPQITTKVPSFYRINSTTGTPCEQTLLDLRERIDVGDLCNFFNEEIRLVKQESLLQKTIRPRAKFTGAGNDFKVLESYLSQADKYVQTGDRFQTQCPLCKSEGRDNHQDNLSIKLSEEKALARCFADESHTFIKIINFIKNGEEHV